MSVIIKMEKGRFYFVVEKCIEPNEITKECEKLGNVLRVYDDEDNEYL